MLPPFIYTKLGVGGCVDLASVWACWFKKVHLHPLSFLHHALHIEMEKSETVLSWWMRVNAVECL